MLDPSLWIAAQKLSISVTIIIIVTIITIIIVTKIPTSK